jgi:hypothetical protein
MKPLSVALVLFGVLGLLQPARQLDLPGALLGVVVRIFLRPSADDGQFQAHRSGD